MVRFLNFAIGFGVIVVSSALTATPAHAQFGSSGFTSYFGKQYLTPSPGNPCRTASFKDHGEVIVLCVDSLGQPLVANQPIKR